ncbi:hypothetical protein [Micromonospora sp. KC721]|uniref:hypothetical protein n=1 Tax=Micromonospora sp. KC721 TaxID=2530380 RepID=UPI0014055305|nr:hypothetical protein [Micromonospora sp. KC721]
MYRLLQELRQVKARRCPPQLAQQRLASQLTAGTRPERDLTLHHRLLTPRDT